MKCIIVCNDNNIVFKCWGSVLEEEFEDNKGVIRICKSKNRQHNNLSWLNIFWLLMSFVPYVTIQHYCCDICYVFKFIFPCCDVRYDFCIKIMFVSTLLQVFRRGLMFNLCYLCFYTYTVVQHDGVSVI
jgi:hypothetical protein